MSASSQKLDRNITLICSRFLSPLSTSTQPFMLLHAEVTWTVSRYDVLVSMHATSELSSSAIFLLTCSQNWVEERRCQPISRAEIFI